MGQTYSIARDGIAQSFRIPAPSLTETNLPDQTGKVFMITGGYTGVGEELSSMLYQHNATVWIAGRSQSKADACINRLKSKHPQSKGQFHFLSIDLADLTTIKPAVNSFLSQEKQLHWLNQNAGVMGPEPGSKGAQDMDLTYQTNILGPFLMTKLLLPILKSTAASSPPNSVRVSFAGSFGVMLSKPGGVQWEGKELKYSFTEPTETYASSKAANYFFGQEFPKHSGSEGVLFNSYNPGNLRTELTRHVKDRWPSVGLWILDKCLYPAIYGAYTELACGLDSDLTIAKDQGAFVVPWGRKWSTRSDLEGEQGAATQRRLWDWCEEKTNAYA